jgi:hypothetical protein
MKSANALDIALSVLAHAAPGTPEADAAKTIEATLNQEGCDFLVAGNKLTDLIDLIVFG